MLIFVSVSQPLDTGSAVALLVLARPALSHPFSLEILMECAHLPRHSGCDFYFYSEHYLDTQAQGLLFETFRDW